MWATGERARVDDITGFVLLVYRDDDQPVLLQLSTERTRLCPVFSTKEKLEVAYAWMGIRDPTYPKKITDQREFLSSFDGRDIMVAADPYVYEGKTRWTAVLPVSAR